MRNQVVAAAGAALALVFAAAGAEAQCVTKGAKAYASSEASAKWYVMETMVQDVSWGLWPGFLQANPEHTAHYKVEGYKITNERYQCKPEGGQVFCRGRATFCKAG
jgi:hypothetical protein